MPISIDEFLGGLSTSGLMTAGEVSALVESLPTSPPPRDARQLARWLVRAGKLTRFQAGVLYQGKTRGLVLGDYLVLDKIGSGGMGHVYRAMHRRMQRVVAIKVLSPSALASAEAQQRFLREVQAAARLTHPNIVIAYDAGEFDGVPYLVMEYVQGLDLASIVSRHGPLPVERAVDYTIQAAQGLEYAHALGVVHRDIKPGNLLVDRFGTVKILDMGLARLDDKVHGPDGKQAGITDSNLIIGTLDYMSPEQAANTSAADARSDVYSLGCTLYRLLTGQVMYPETSPVGKLLAHREADTPSLRAARPEVSEYLDAVFQKMVAKRPEDRYQSMADVCVALRAPEATQRIDVPTNESEDEALEKFLANLAQRDFSSDSDAAELSADRDEDETEEATPQVEDATAHPVPAAASAAAAPVEALSSTIIPAATVVAPDASSTSLAVLPQVEPVSRFEIRVEPEPAAPLATAASRPATLPASDATPARPASRVEIAPRAMPRGRVQLPEWALPLGFAAAMVALLIVILSFAVSQGESAAPRRETVSPAPAAATSDPSTSILTREPRGAAVERRTY